MRRIVKPNTDIKQFTESTKTPDPLISDISVDSLIGDCLLALHREVKSILMLGVKGKLDSNAARDLRDHLKVLFEIKDREKDLLKSLSDAELAALLEKVKNVSNP